LTDTVRSQTAPRYLSNPLSLKITCGELPSGVVDVIVEITVGRAVLRRCGVRTARDAFGHIGIDVESQLYEWVKHLLEAERQRQLAIRGEPLKAQPKSPAWPSVPELPDPDAVARYYRSRRDPVQP
jgi:hypothetical protein